ncbi:amylovoran biosynthesis protein AmsE [Escherichia coli]|nr:amylovoran biosynthesis protein AmsE [Escherichia coli]KAA1861441.1 amylovoran biosynthesis protein AmsE [Escherichia coli]
MDTDDICRNDRFLRQVKILESDNNLALIGSYISEFDSTPSNSHAVRTVPIEHNDICLYAKKRNPFNHMTVAFRKSVVTSLGGYKDEYLYEDYALWIKMLKNGFLTKNIPEALVYARVGNNMELKRGGWKYFTSEVKAQYGFYKIGFLNKQEMIINIVLRAPVRLMPNFMRKIIYRNLLRN